MMLSMAKQIKNCFKKTFSYPLLCSLEIIDEYGKLERKADMFTKRTIQKYEPITHVDTRHRRTCSIYIRKGLCRYWFYGWFDGWK